MSCRSRRGVKQRVPVAVGVMFDSDPRGDPMRRSLLLLLSLAACSPAKGDGAACGMAAVFGPAMLLSEFATPGQTLGAPPESLPGRLVARLVAGPALPALVGRDRGKWMVGVDGHAPRSFSPGFGVLVEDTASRPLGVMIYEGETVRGAPILGHVSVADTLVPLIGISLPSARFEDARCTVFPDSILR